MPLFEKIETIAKRIYRADEVLADNKIRNQLKEWEEAGYGNLPVCMAKTQYSFSTDPSLRGAPTGHSVPVREVRLSAGAGFHRAVCGEIMTMPGLPRKPAAESIRLNDEARSKACSKTLKANSAARDTSGPQEFVKHDQTDTAAGLRLDAGSCALEIDQAGPPGLIDLVE